MLFILRILLVTMHPAVLTPHSASPMFENIFVSCLLVLKAAIEEDVIICHDKHHNILSFNATYVL